MTKCSSCDDDFEHDRLQSDIHGKLVCESCFSDDDPIGTIEYPDGTKIEVGHHRADWFDDDGELITGIDSAKDLDFDFKWHRTDGWRGYYESTSKNYIAVNEDTILHASNDEKDLKEFSDAVEDLLQARKIRYAKVFSRTSNVFSTSYDFFVHKKDMKKYEKVGTTIAMLKTRLRDPVKFTKEAYGLGDGPESTILLRSIGLLKDGKTPAQALKIAKAEVEILVAAK